MLSKILLAIFIAGLLFTTQFLFSKTQFSLGTILSPVAESENEIPAPTYPTWSPDTPQVGAIFDSKLVSTAKASLSYDITNEKVVFSKNATERLPMASLSKIMTAFLALEEEENKLYRVKTDSLVGENSMGLTEGEVLTRDELLYGLMLPSGNDAAEVLAHGSKWGRDGFVKEMNKRAKQLEMYDTNFTNPSGLEGDGNQYSTAVDLLKLTKLAMENPTFAQVVGTYEIELPYSNNHKYFYLYNDTNLLTSYPGVKGVKTGFTWEAGLCLVTYMEHNDRTIIAVLLNSQNRRQEMKDLLDYTLVELGETPPEHE